VATETPADHARHALLALHKSLIDAGREAVEKETGKKLAPAEMLQLLVGDPRFAWLSALTTLIVRLDEAMEPDADESVETVVAFATNLLTPDADSTAPVDEKTSAFRKAYGEQLANAHVALVGATARDRQRVREEPLEVAQRRSLGTHPPGGARILLLDLLEKVVRSVVDAGLLSAKGLLHEGIRLLPLRVRARARQDAREHKPAHHGVSSRSSFSIFGSVGRSFLYSSSIFSPSALRPVCASAIARLK